jgi:LPXTG-motif cell wall-anchored protein
VSVDGGEVTARNGDEDVPVTDARPPGLVPPPTSSGEPPAPSFAGPQASWRPVRKAGVPGLRGTRDDLRSALLTVLALAVTGVVAGGLWIWLAPRADYRVTATGVEPIGTAPSPELFMADDTVFVLVLAGLGLLAGVAVWLHRRRRGVLTLVALATGMLAAGVVAWQLGEWAGPAPTDAQLADAGTTVTTALSLNATAALAVGPFVAVLTYLVATALTSRDDLGRHEDEPVDPPLRLPLPPVPPPVPRGQ